MAVRTALASSTSTPCHEIPAGPERGWRPGRCQPTIRDRVSASSSMRWLPANPAAPVTRIAPVACDASRAISNRWPESTKCGHENTKPRNPRMTRTWCSSAVVVAFGLWRTETRRRSARDAAESAVERRAVAQAGERERHEEALGDGDREAGAAQIVGLILEGHATALGVVKAGQALLKHRGSEQVVVERVNPAESIIAGPDVRCHV